MPTLKLKITVFLIFVFSISCSQPKQSEKMGIGKIGLKNYFDSDDRILIKLYKKSENTFLYWETWNTDSKNAIIHWGDLGSYGEQQNIITQNPASLKDSVNSLIASKLDEGFVEVAESEHFTVEITFKLKTWGNSDDLDRQENYRSIITENLGWTGNGRCDDSDIGSGEMTLFGEVIDPYLAIKTITEELKKHEIQEEYYYNIYKGDSVIKENIFPPIVKAIK